MFLRSALLVHVPQRCLHLHRARRGGRRDHTAPWGASGGQILDPLAEQLQSYLSRGGGVSFMSLQELHDHVL